MFVCFLACLGSTPAILSNLTINSIVTTVTDTAYCRYCSDSVSTTVVIRSYAPVYTMHRGGSRGV